MTRKRSPDFSFQPSLQSLPSPPTSDAPQTKIYQSPNYDKGKVEVLYSLDKTGGLGYVPTPLFIDDLLYLWSDKGMLTCREALSGKEVYSEKVGGIYFSSPIAINDRIYCSTRDGIMAVIQAGRDFKILSKYDFESDIFATPAVADGRLIVRTKTHLICIGKSK